jgi:hypothetical protein
VWRMDSCSTNQPLPDRKAERWSLNKEHCLLAHFFHRRSRYSRLCTNRRLLTERNSWKSVFSHCRRSSGKPRWGHRLYVAEFQKFSGTRYIRTRTPASHHLTTLHYIKVKKRPKRQAGATLMSSLRTVNSCGGIIWYAAHSQPTETRPPFSTITV